MAITVNNKVYRNLQEQVLKNQEDIATIDEGITSIEEDIAVIEEDIATIDTDITTIKEDIAALEEGGGGGGSQPTYLQVSDPMSFDWYGAIADALGVTSLPSDDINSGELLLSFDEYTCYAPDNSGKSIKKTKVYFTITYAGQGTHSLTLSINFNGKLYIAESYSELQTDSTYKFIFARPYLNFSLPS